MGKDENDWLTVEDIYEELDKKIPLDTIRSWIRSGRLSAFRPGKSYLVRRSDLNKFLEDSRTKPDEGP